MTKGGRNIILLGAIAITIAVATTSIALKIYHDSGDIYLDRSRPGYINPEKAAKENKEKEENGAQSYTFPKTGDIDAAAIEEYIEQYQKIINEIDQTNNPFDGSIISDEALGI